MSQIYQNLGQIIIMLFLLACSAFFSGSETAFFNLTRRQIATFRSSSSRIPKLIAGLLDQPKNLLGSLLFGNMLVNVLFFAAASVLTLGLEREFGVTAAAVCAIIAFGALVLLGEIVPKSLAYANTASVARFAALPAYILIKIFNPIVLVFRILLIEPIVRLLIGADHTPKPVSKTEFITLVDQVSKRGLITSDENRLLSEIVELGLLKVKDCLVSRVDMIACDVTISNVAMRGLMVKHGLTKIPVYVRDIDNIVGIVNLRQLILNPGISPDKLVAPVKFIPEQKTVESLLDLFRKSGIDIAIVVDEYGGISGQITVEDIAEEIFGPAAEEGIPIKQLGPFTYRLAGDLPVHEWAGTLGIDPAQTRVATIGGLVGAALGKVPHAGDIATINNLKFTVERVKRRRIESVILSLEFI